MSELKGLLIATARPPENKQKPKIGQDLRKRLPSYLKEDAVLQIDQAIYPERQRKRDVLSGRITQKKLRTMNQKTLARVLGTSQPRVSQLFKTGEIRKYILEAGKRDAVLIMLDNAKRQ
jgi:predicted XRE-type DNA-binding protein